MLDMLKAELGNIRKEKDQVIAHYNALLGAEKVLEKVIAQAEKPVIPEKGETK